MREVRRPRFYQRGTRCLYGDVSSAEKTIGPGVYGESARPYPAVVMYLECHRVDAGAYRGQIGSCAASTGPESGGRHD